MKKEKKTTKTIEILQYKYELGREEIYKQHLQVVK